MNDYQAHSDKAKPTTPLPHSVRRHFVLGKIFWLIIRFFFLKSFYRLFAKLTREKWKCAPRFSQTRDWNRSEEGYGHGRESIKQAASPGEIF